MSRGQSPSHGRWGHGASRIGSRHELLRRYRSRTRSTSRGGASVADRARGLGGARPRRSSRRARSTTSPAAPVARRRCARTGRRSSGGGCGRGCCGGTRSAASRWTCSGLRSAAPFLLGPVGVLSIAHRRASSACAVPPRERRADSSSRVPRRVRSRRSPPSSARRRGGSSSTGGPIARSVASFVARASAAGYRAIVVTLDTMTLGWRPAISATGTCLPPGRGLAQFFSDPLFRATARHATGGGRADGVAMALAAFPNLGLTWGDLEWLRGRRAADARQGRAHRRGRRLALEHGVDGIIVSNHGGRQVDGAVASLDALVEVREELGDGGRAHGRRHPPRRGRRSRRSRSAPTRSCSAAPRPTASPSAGRRASRR